VFFICYNVVCFLLLLLLLLFYITLCFDSKLFYLFRYESLAIRRTPEHIGSHCGGILDNAFDLRFLPAGKLFHLFYFNSFHTWSILCEKVFICCSFLNIIIETLHHIWEVPGRGDDCSPFATLCWNQVCIRFCPHHFFGMRINLFVVSIKYDWYFLYYCLPHAHSHHR
jgi:hypothetical protein